MFPNSNPIAFLLGLWFFIGSSFGVAAEPAIVPCEGFNLEILETSDAKIKVAPLHESYANNWFAARFSQLPTDRETVVEVQMESAKKTGKKLELTSRWKGLSPVMTYADPTLYESYEWFQRNDEGQWVSGDAFKRGAARLAGSGEVPIQKLVPSQLARECLSDEGRVWCAWREIPTAAPKSGAKFVFRHSFARPSAAVAMRVPFTPTYWAQWVERLQNAQLPGVTVDEIGESSSKRKLWCIRVEDPTGAEATSEIKTVVIFAREHATEQATSWAVLGLLKSLLRDSVEMEALRSRVRFLIVPLQDPDGAAMSRFEHITNRWGDPKNNTLLQEVMAYSGYFRDRVDKGETLDLAVSIHNVGANEAPNFMAPFTQQTFRKTTEAFNAPLFQTLREAGYLTSASGPHQNGVMSARLYGWLALQFGAMDMAYEVNDRYPPNPLSLPRLEQLGALFGQELSQWMLSPAGEKRHQQARQALEKRAQARTDYYAADGPPTSDVARRFDLLVQGF